MDALKFIVSANDNDYGDVGEVGQSSSKRPIPIYVQPMDEVDAEKNAANLALATQLALAKGYRLSLQLHKIVGVP